MKKIKCLTAVITIDSLFLLSGSEIGYSWSNEYTYDEGPQYQYITEYIANDKGDPVSCGDPGYVFLRSVSQRGEDYFLAIYSNGEVYSELVTTPACVAPCFCI